MMGPWSAQVVGSSSTTWTFRGLSAIQSAQKSAVKSIQSTTSTFTCMKTIVRWACNKQKMKKKGYLLRVRGWEALKVSLNGRKGCNTKFSVSKMAKLRYNSTRGWQHKSQGQSVSSDRISKMLQACRERTRTIKIANQPRRSKPKIFCQAIGLTLHTTTRQWWSKLWSAQGGGGMRKFRMPDMCRNLTMIKRNNWIRSR